MQSVIKQNLQLSGLFPLVDCMNEKNSITKKRFFLFIEIEIKMSELLMENLFQIYKQEMCRIYSQMIILNTKLIKKNTYDKT